MMMPTGPTSYRIVAHAQLLFTDVCDILKVSHMLNGVTGEM
jgi:hypothetical protein